MIDPKLFDEFAQRLNNSVPEGVRALQQDLDRNLRAGVQAALNRLDLVTREEFDVQAKVLARTRARLDAMTARVAALEAQVFAQTNRSKSASAAQSTSSASDQDMDGG